MTKLRCWESSCCCCSAFNIVRSSSTEGDWEGDWGWSWSESGLDMVNDRVRRNRRMFKCSGEDRSWFRREESSEVQIECTEYRLRHLWPSWGSFITVLYFRCDLVNVSITNFPAVKMINVMNLRYKNITYSNSQQAQSTESMNEIPHCVKCNNELEYGLRNRI